MKWTVHPFEMPQLRSNSFNSKQNLISRLKSNDLKATTHNTNEPRPQYFVPINSIFRPSAKDFQQARCVWDLHMHDAWCHLLLPPAMTLPQSKLLPPYSKERCIRELKAAAPWRRRYRATTTTHCTSLQVPKNCHSRCKTCYSDNHHLHKTPNFISISTRPLPTWNGSSRTFGSNIIQLRN